MSDASGRSEASRRTGRPRRRRPGDRDELRRGRAKDPPANPPRMMRSGPAHATRASPPLTLSDASTPRRRRGTGTAQGERSRPDRRRRSVPSTRREAARVMSETERTPRRDSRKSAEHYGPWFLPRAQSRSQLRARQGPVRAPRRRRGRPGGRGASGAETELGKRRRGPRREGVQALDRGLATDPFRGISSRWRRWRRIAASGATPRRRSEVAGRGMFGPGRLEPLGGRLRVDRRRRRASPRPSRGYAPGTVVSFGGLVGTFGAVTARFSDLQACWRSCDGRTVRSRATRRRCGHARRQAEEG